MVRQRGTRRGFSIFELLVVFTVVGIMAGVGSMKLQDSSAKLKKQFEAKRLLSVLRALRDLANNGGVDAATGYGVFFWRNPVTGSCYEYSPYVPRTANTPNAHVNAFGSFPLMGLPNVPLILGIRPQSERQAITGTARSEGMDIYFQSDQAGVVDQPPTAIRQWDGSGNPTQPVPAGSWKDNAVIFWPAGQRPNAGGPWASAFWYAPCIGPQHGVLLPRNGCSGVVYNRIYIRHEVDATANPVAPDRSIPARIWIHPATGVMRLMEPYERRADGTW
jgi:type II secretory pathway pseudopilin PulG